MTRNVDIQNYARLLIATEQHAAQVYWHLYPRASSAHRDQPYPEQGLRDLVTIGNVQDWQAGAWLYVVVRRFLMLLTDMCSNDSFWGNQKIQIAAIQILPVTPINEYMYDATWAQAVYDYTQEELNNSTYDDSWKSVIYLAYSQANPSLATQRSTALTSWGSGNSYSNQMYFLSTRPNATGVCTTASANPLGTFYIQSAMGGKYIGTASLPNLVATAGSTAQAARFNFGFAPNAGTIQEVSTRQYVTADLSGTYTLSAGRAVASAWEVFIVRPKLGGASGVHSILAASNKEYVVLGSDGGLVNSGLMEKDSAGFRLVPA